MTSRRTVSIVVAGLALAAAPAIAQPRDTPGRSDGTPDPMFSITLSEDDAVARALAASNRVAEAQARTDAAAAVVGMRHAPSRPQVAAVGGYTRTNHVDEFGILLPNNQLRVIYPDIPDNYHARLDLQWPLYTGGRLSALEAAARSEQAATMREVDATRVDVRLETTRAFWALVTARETMRVVDESLARMSEHVRDVRNQLAAGLVPPNELLTAQAQEARQRMLSIQARTSRDMAEADLARLVGVPPGTRIDASASLDLPVVDTAIDRLIAEAKQGRPERQALDARLEAAASRQRAADAARKPTVAVAAGVDYARPNPRIFPRMGDWRESWDAGVNVSWLLFDGGRTRSEVAEAAASARAVRARLADFDAVVALEIRQRISELESSAAAVDAADVAVRAATEARRVVGERFNAGVATSTDVVDAQVSILQAQLDRTQAIAAAHLADARLKRALGR
ncbi:MAG TPA: TolC family protein [Vicinamibacterales bacterium]|nr:TolC family protein [Vicinamibacterales bacterium]